MIRLGINIDHIATLRNARDESYPNPVQAAAYAEQGGADNITCHLREDRRHIRDADVRQLKETIQVPLNFEIAATEEMIQKALEIEPFAVTLVPEKREEKTTESGLRLSEFGLQAADPYLESSIRRLKEKKILVSLFVEATVQDMSMASQLGADAVEMHTGPFCVEEPKARLTKDKKNLLSPYIEAAEKAYELGLQVHVGHGLNYTNASWMQWIPHIEEANIGHAVIGRAVFVGLTQATREMKALLNDPFLKPTI